jgi:hypothetical protein
MIAVADTSPICSLIPIGEIDLLPKLFSQVLVPEAVLAAWPSKPGNGFVGGPQFPICTACDNGKLLDELPAQIL